jgi:hypothetical protein
MSRTPTHRAWAAMLTRVRNPRAIGHKDYHDRNIQVCERWLKFENFLEDVGEKPGPKYTIDRFPNNDGNYGPGNVRWATASEQQNNKRDNRIIEFLGQRKTLAQWIRHLNIDTSEGRSFKLAYAKIWKRLARGYSPSRAFEVSV